MWRDLSLHLLTTELVRHVHLGNTVLSQASLSVLHARVVQQPSNLTQPQLANAIVSEPSIVFTSGSATVFESYEH